MTVLGMNCCTQDRSYGWADIKASAHRPSQPANLPKLMREFRQAEDLLQGYIESDYVNEVTVARLEARVKVAEDAIEQAWREFEAVWG